MIAPAAPAIIIAANSVVDAPRTSWANSTYTENVIEAEALNKPRIDRHRAQQLVVPQPAHPFGELVPPRPLERRPRPGRGASSDGRDQRRRDDERPGVDEERHGEPDREHQRPERRTGELVGRLLGRPQPAVRLLQLVGATSEGINVWAQLS